MVEVFKTNVRSREQADRLIWLIRQSFAGFTVNFDLDDCDRILRVQCDFGFIPSALLTHLLRGWGCNAEVLQPSSQKLLLS